MARIFLFATIGGAMVVAAWMAISYLRRVAFRKSQETRARMEERARALLAAQEPGGSSQNPIVVQSPSVVEPRAGAAKCSRCGGSVRVLDHQARLIDGKRFRVAVIQCKRCGLEREIFFQLSALN